MPEIFIALPELLAGIGSSIGAGVAGIGDAIGLGGAAAGAADVAGAGAVGAGAADAAAGAGAGVAGTGLADLGGIGGAVAGLADTAGGAGAGLADAATGVAGSAAAAPAVGVASAPAAVGGVGGAAGAAAPAGIAATGGDIAAAAPAATEAAAASGAPAGLAAPGAAVAPSAGASLAPAASGASLAPAAATPAASTAAAAGGDGLSLSGIGSTLMKNPSLLLTGGMLAKNLLSGNQKPEGQAALEAQASQLSQQGNQLAGYLNSGTLPPGVGASLTAAHNAAAATLKSQYASRGMSGSSAEQQDLANLAQTTVSQGAQIATQLLSQGVSEQEFSAQIYQKLMAASAASDKAMSDSMARFAGALSGSVAKAA